MGKALRANDSLALVQTFSCNNVKCNNFYCRKSLQDHKLCSFGFSTRMFFFFIMFYGGFLHLFCFQHPQNFIPQTPLTNRRYLKEKEIRITPVSTATQIVSRLQALLSGQKSSPSEELSSMFQKCKENPSETILARVKEMGQTFCEKYTQVSEIISPQGVYPRRHDVCLEFIQRLV